MRLLPFVAAFAFTSVLAACVATDRSLRALALALGRLGECLGVAAVFLLGNLAVGAIVGYLGTRAGWAGVSLYTITDWTVPVLSLFQAIMYCGWADGRRASR